MPSKKGYYESDEWAEFDDYLHRAADRHDLDVRHFEKSTGIWQGETEPSGAYEVTGDLENIKSWASEIAGRYEQDAVMVAWADKNGSSTQHVYSIPHDTNPEELAQDLSAAGIQGASATDGQLRIIDTDKDISSEALAVLSARYEKPESSTVSVDFIEGDLSKESHAPIKEIQMVRQLHAEEHDLPQRGRIVHFTDEDDMAAAKAYAECPHDPEHPKIKRSYRTFRRHIAEQYERLSNAGYQFHPWHGKEEQPYANSAEMLKDLRDNKRLYYYRTEVSQGTDGALPSDHPMAQTITVNNPDGTKQQLLANDAFRAVHDTIAHSEGHSFGPQGEKLAWWTHRSSLPREAHLALWNETRAQNVWTNAGPHMQADNSDGSKRVLRRDDEAWLPQTERPYSEQKCVVPPKAIYI
ncbi:hypothetical protein ACTXIU_13330 [Glutamicibacter arilaitensis]|uniref:hypothetical protein n=1 Tax=Glutamicibacter arilaitensis TaxID=256701 RepID=UPI003FD3EF4D